MAQNETGAIRWRATDVLLTSRNGVGRVQAIATSLFLIAFVLVSGIRQSVSVTGFRFDKTDMTVPAGTRVTWTNLDEIAHSVTSGGPGSADGRFDGALEKRGAVFTHAFVVPGTYHYHCARHPFMRGVVRVVSRGE